MRDIKTYYHLLLVPVILLPLYLLITCIVHVHDGQNILNVVVYLVYAFVTKANLLKFKFNETNSRRSPCFENDQCCYFHWSHHLYKDKSKRKLPYPTILPRLVESQLNCRWQNPHCRCKSSWSNARNNGWLLLEPMGA